MKNTFSKQLYSAQNRLQKRMLILASSVENAEDIAFKQKLVKDINDLSLQDISDEYLTPSRLEKGLNFDKLKEGKFMAAHQGQECKWMTA